MSVRVLYVAARKNVSFLSKISSRLNNAVKADKNWNKTIYLVTDLVRRDLLFKLSFIFLNIFGSGINISKVMLQLIQ